MDSRLKSSRDRPRLRLVTPPDWPPRADPRRAVLKPAEPPPRWRRGFVIRTPGAVHELRYRLSREKPTEPDLVARFDPDWKLWLSIRTGERLE